MAEPINPLGDVEALASLLGIGAAKARTLWDRYVRGNKMNAPSSSGRAEFMSSPNAPSVPLSRLAVPATTMTGPEKDLLSRVRSAYQKNTPDWLQDAIIDTGNKLNQGVQLAQLAGFGDPANVGVPGVNMARLPIAFGKSPVSRAAALAKEAANLKNIEKATKLIESGNYTIDLAKLGRKVPMEDFKAGFITEDGKFIQMSGDAATHVQALAKATGLSKEAVSKNLPKIMADQGFIRAHAPGVFGGRTGGAQWGELSSEVFTAPSDAQINALRGMERLHEMPLSFELAHPETGNFMGTGLEVKNLRRTIRDTEMEKGGLWTGEHIPANGAEITMPARSYSEATAEKPIDTHTGAGGNNIWVRQHNEPSNKDRTLMMQFSNRLINPRSGQPSTVDQYFDKIYNARKGYVRPDDFFEIPQWQANMAHNMKNVDSYVVRDPAEAEQFLRKAGYGNVAFSSLDVTAPRIRELAQNLPNQKFSVGGYSDLKSFSDLPNVKTFDSMPKFIESQGGRTYKDGYDYRHFAGTPTVPRLTMSTGCSHSCAFCSMPRKVVENSPESVMQQADAIAKDLPSDLVYLNDKTFGQAKNYEDLPKVYDRIKKQNPNFKGFIVQTTAAQMKKMSPEFLEKSGIKQVELGLESFNDPILKAVKKPANEKLINEAAQKLRDAKIELIPNLIVGLPGEDAHTYWRTMNWLKANDDIISHVNVNNLAIYKDAELANQFKPKNATDLNQNIVEKSWHEDPAIHTGFYNDATRFGSEQLDKVPFQNVKPPFNIDKLGDKVPANDFLDGWLAPDGSFYQYPMGDVHHDAIVAAAGANPVTAELNLPSTASEQGLIRITTPYGQWGELGAELFSSPTDAQLRSMRELEKIHQTPLAFDLSVPSSGEKYGGVVTSGNGVNQIRKEINSAELYKEALKPTPPPEVTTGTTKPIQNVTPNPAPQVGGAPIAAKPFGPVRSQAEKSQFAATRYGEQLPTLDEYTQAQQQAQAPGLLKKLTGTKQPKIGDVARLGSPVPADQFEVGWIDKDGKYLQMPEGTYTHLQSVANALGAKSKLDVEHLIPEFAVKNELVRAAAPVGTSKGRPLAVEFFSEPNDAQIRAVRNLENIHGTEAMFDLSLPETGTALKSGTGVKNVRRSINDLKSTQAAPTATKVQFDPWGMGSTPNTIDAPYRGFRKTMTPDEYLSLTDPVGGDAPERVARLVQGVKEGKPFANPFLEAEWNAGKGRWETTGSQEGRHRALALKQLDPSATMPVDIFPGGKTAYMRNKHITPEMAEAPVIKGNETLDEFHDRVQKTLAESRALLNEPNPFMPPDQLMPDYVPTLPAPGGGQVTLEDLTALGPRIQPQGPQLTPPAPTFPGGEAPGILNPSFESPYVPGQKNLTLNELLNILHIGGGI